MSEARRPDPEQGTPRPAEAARTRVSVTPAPRLRERILAMLYPLPGAEAGAPRSIARAAFWLLLAMLFAAGVVAPFVMPDTVRQWTHAKAKPATDVQLPPGTRFRDCKHDSCPWLTVVPPGRFNMGSPAAESGRYVSEDPQHEVRIASPLAIMEAEVTRGQFAAFVKETNYATAGGCFKWNGTKFESDPKGTWANVGFEQTDQHPVVCINWNDAQAYAAWLSKRTGQTYRLLSEAEWEYAARAGKQTRFWFGDKDEDLCTHANVADRSARAGLKEVTKDWTIAECTDNYVFTAPVKSYKANAFGLYDVHGNAWEWTQDCWHENYKGAPNDGLAWESDCGEVRRVVRGGGWIIVPRGARSANRYGGNPDDRDINSGFRLARTLTP
jgi:formylglycine-generating enzyme required for sulfatase activity